jgi:hypothetical protein
MRIFIDIKHNNATYQVLRYRLECLGWLVAPNAQPDNINWIKLTNGLGRFFILDIESRELTWKGGEDYDGEGNEDVIDTPAAACGLADFLAEKADFLKDVPLPAPKHFYSEYQASWEVPPNAYLKQQEQLLKAMTFAKQKQKAHFTATQLAKQGAYYKDPPYFVDYIDKIPNPYAMESKLQAIIDAKLQAMKQMMAQSKTELLTVKHFDYNEWMNSAGEPGIDPQLYYQQYSYKPKDK